MGDTLVPARKPTRARRTPAGERRWRAAFLDALAATSNVTASAQAAKVTTARAYDARRADPAFYRAWQEALCEGYEHLEMALLQRLRAGEIKPAGGAKKGVRVFDNAAVEALRTDVDDVKTRLDRVGRAAVRPMIGGGTTSVEVKSFVDGYLRQGRETEVKSLSGAVASDGGYAVPREIDALIASRLKDISPIRAIAQVVQTGSAGYRKLVTTGGTASGWVSETTARPETATPSFAEIAPPSGELYANPAASQAMLDDAGFDLESWLADEIASEFARAEGSAFVNGSGLNRPKGFLAAPMAATDDATRAFGTLQFLGTGAAAGLGAEPESKLIDLVHALKSGHRQGASWVMNSATLAQVRKLKTSDGAFVWQAGLAMGQPDRLLGYPVVEAEDMPDIAAGAFPIAFGNFRAGYLIAERTATSILRDPFTNKPFVHFYATKRIGGQVLDSDAIKLLKITA